MGALHDSRVISTLGTYPVYWVLTMAKVCTELVGGVKYTHTHDRKSTLLLLATTGQSLFCTATIDPAVFCQ